MTGRTSRNTPLRLSFQITLFLVGLAAFGAVLLLAMGTWNKFVHETAPPLMDWPGGPWVLGVAFGLVTLLGWRGGKRLATGFRSGTGARHVVRASGSALCWLMAIGAGIYLLTALPSRNCSSSRPDCAYVPGTGSALVSYAITVGALGWLLYRWGNARAEERAVRQRERMRKIRKRGGGKSRAARRP